MMSPEPSRCIKPEPAHSLTAWQRVAREACTDRRDAHTRLTAALNILGTDIDHDLEQGLSERQQTLEQLIRSVAVYLAR